MSKPKQVLARAAGTLYVITIVAGTYAFLYESLAANLLAGLAYVGVTILFYFLFAPVSRGLSLLAAVVSLAGCALGALSAAQLLPFPVRPLVFFGVYCLLIAYLISKSPLLPKFLAAFMAIGGIGWLTFGVPALSRTLMPYNMVPGILAETALALWLLIMGMGRGRTA